MLNRYITMDCLDGKGIICYHEDEDWKYDQINRAEEWVWQYAENPEQAIAQHEQKHDEWCDDQDNLREFKDTY